MALNFLELMKNSQGSLSKLDLDNQNNPILKIIVKQHQKKKIQKAREKLQTIHKKNTN